ncbi:hypothetical protein H6P81_005855 [Aristolochia fimbriata]|uniref:Uncharacterized protein n=1 Tax=Aristolochia fimbriata TaxID=158543 RepID=A0AAV7EYG1_ARIFI|nr:hypothetical protein H6P81_005855 [Aristolochia fimbriata]
MHVAISKQSHKKAKEKNGFLTRCHAEPFLITNLVRKMGGTSYLYLAEAYPDYADWNSHLQNEETIFPSRLLL